MDNTSKSFTAKLPMATDPHAEDQLFAIVDELVRDLGSNAPRAIVEKVEKAKREYHTAKKIIANPPGECLRDMPDSVLQGRLGEICETRLSRFPRAYAWPAAVAVASALIGERTPGVRTNLYVGLVGPVHSGKSQAIEYAIRSLGLEKPALMDATAGSAEALIRETAGASGNSRLFSPDELGHTLEKMRIERSSFSYVFNSAYYKTQFKVLMGKKENVTFDCVLSIVGGLVEERFQELFNAATTAGLYDRFTFGLCPGDFRFDYRPFEGSAETASTIPVSIDPSVWEFMTAWKGEFKELNPRVVENAIRCAVICASFDHKSVLMPKDLDPHLALTRYQTRIREILKPNSGENYEGRLANKFLNYLGRNKGAYVARRKLFHDCRAHDLGLSVAERALSTLVANGDVQEVTVGKAKLVRLILENDNDDLHDY